MSIVADSLLDVGRCLAGCLAPITGQQVRVKAKVEPISPGLALLPGQFLVPNVGGAREDLLFRVAPNRHVAGGRWPDAGTVELVSNVGGARHNVVVQGTQLRFDPVPAGFGPIAVVTQVIEKSDDQDVPLLRGAIMSESVPALTDVELWRSYLGGHFPAALVLWSDGEPAAGLATSTLERGASRVGEGGELMAENWVVFIVSSRDDAGSARQGEGLRLLERATSLLKDRQTLDGLVFSAPTGVQVRRRLVPSFRSRDLQQAYQVYEIDLTTTRLLQREDSRAYHPLRGYNVNVDKHDPDAEDLRLVDNMRMQNEQE